MLYRYDIIKWRMENLELTVEMLSLESGISTRTISNARTGKNLKVETLSGIAARLGLRMKALFDFELPISHASRAVET